MTRRRSTSPRRGSAGIGASERHRPRQPIGRLGTIAESADMPSTSAQIGEALMERRASDSPRRDSAQISVGRRHRSAAAFWQAAHDRRDRRNSQCLVPDRQAAYRFRHATCAPIWPVGTHFRPRYCAADGGKSR